MNDDNSTKIDAANPSTNSFKEVANRKEREWKQNMLVSYIYRDSNWQRWLKNLFTSLIFFPITLQENEDIEDKDSNVIANFPSKEGSILDESRLKKKYWTPKRRLTQDWSHLVTFTCNVCSLGKQMS